MKTTIVLEDVKLKKAFALTKIKRASSKPEHDRIRLRISPSLL